MVAKEPLLVGELLLVAQAIAGGRTARTDGSKAINGGRRSTVTVPSRQLGSPETDASRSPKQTFKNSQTDFLKSKNPTSEK